MALIWFSVLFEQTTKHSFQFIQLIAESSLQKLTNVFMPEMRNFELCIRQIQMIIYYFIYNVSDG